MVGPLSEHISLECGFFVNNRRREDQLLDAEKQRRKAEMEKVEKKEIAKGTQKRKIGDIVRIVTIIVFVLLFGLLLTMAVIRKFAG
jgi:hypothetical protein